MDSYPSLIKNLTLTKVTPPVEPKFIEQKDYKKRFFKMEITGFKGQDRTTQLQEKKSNSIYHLVEQNINVKSFDQEFQKYQKLSELKHQNLLNLCFYTYLFSQESHGEPTCKVSLIFDNIEIDLQQWFEKQKLNKEYLDYDTLISLVDISINTLAYLQESGFSHGNLTLSTFYVDKSNSIKVMPNYFQPKKIIQTKHTFSKGKEPKKVYYYSPEKYKLKNSRIPYDKPNVNEYKSDVFTLGMLILELATLQNLSKFYGLYELDQKGIKNLLAQVKDRYPETLIELLSKMLASDEQERPTFIDLLEKVKLMKLPEYNVNIVSRVSNNDEIQKINNPSYLPQDFVNEIDAEIQKGFRKAANKMEEMGFDSGNKYIGQRNSKEQPHGIGTFWFANGDRYEGFWKNGEYSGEGIYYSHGGMKHFGMFEKGEISGLGVRYYVEKGIYFGQWKNGKNHGKGIFIWPNGEKFIGNFKDDKIEGDGILTWLSGRKIEGLWRDIGKGIGLEKMPKDKALMTINHIGTARTILFSQSEIN